MDVGAGRTARTADVADDLSADDILPDADDIARVVSVESLSSVAMLDDDVVTVATIPTAFAGDDDLARSGGKNGRACGRREVDAVVSMDALGPYAALDRSEIVPAVIRAPRRGRPWR